MPLSPSTPVGAFTNLTIAAINAALVQAGLASTTGNVFYCDPVNGLDTNNGQVPAKRSRRRRPGAIAGRRLRLSAFRLQRCAGADRQRAVDGLGAHHDFHLVQECGSPVRHLRTVGSFAARSHRQSRLLRAWSSPRISSPCRGNGCLFSNLSWFAGRRRRQTGIAASICLTVSGQRNAFLNCDFEGMGDTTASADAGSRNLLLSAAAENLFLALQHRPRHRAAHERQLPRSKLPATRPAQHVRELHLPGRFLATACSTCSWRAAAAAMDRWVLFKGCMFINVMGSGSDHRWRSCSTWSPARAGFVMHGRSQLARPTASPSTGDATTHHPDLSSRAWPEPPPAASRTAGHETSRHRNSSPAQHSDPPPERTSAGAGSDIRPATTRNDERCEPAEHFLNGRQTPRIREADACRSGLPASFDSYRRNLRQLPARDRSHERNALRIGEAADLSDGMV